MDHFIRQLIEFTSNKNITLFFRDYFYRNLQRLFANYDVRYFFQFYKQYIRLEPLYINPVSFSKLCSKFTQDTKFNDSIIKIQENSISKLLSHEFKLSSQPKVCKLICGWCKKLLMESNDSEFKIITNNNEIFTIHIDCYNNYGRSKVEITSSNSFVSEYFEEYYESVYIENVINGYNNLEHDNFFEDIEKCLTIVQQTKGIKVNDKALDNFYIFQRPKQAYFDRLFIDF